MKKSFYKWLDNKTDNENDWVKEEEGIRYFFCVDTIFEVFWEKADVTEEIMENDDLDEILPIWKEYAKEHKPFHYTDKDIQERIREDNAEMHTRSMEMGWGGSFTSNSRGQRTYFPYDDY
jgi:hypothetical protein